MSVIARAFELENKAREAAERLIAEGINESQITLIVPHQDGAAAGLRAGKALRMLRESESFAIALERGQTLLIADTPFGTGVAMSRVLDDYGPAPLEAVADRDDPESKSAPFSYTFGWPVLMRNNPAPFSTALGFSIESENKNYFGKFFGRLIGSSRSLSGMVGLPLLTRNGGTTFGKELHHEHLGDSAMGIPLLKKEASPLGVKALLDSPTPLSSLLGLPVLTKNK